MNSTQKPLSVLKWTLYTSGGWFTGFALTMLIIIPFEALGIGNQSMIGIGMGAGVGLMQAVLLNRYRVSGKRWFWSSFLGMSVPYILYDVLAKKINMGPETALPVVTAAGGLLVGVLQYNYVLKPISEKSKSWIILTGLGWTTAHVLLTVINLNAVKQLHFPAFFNVLLVVICILSGGPLLGLFTGRSIVSALENYAN